MPKAPKNDVQVAPCNDPSRPDWQWFRDVLLPITASASEEQNSFAAEIRPLLEVPVDPQTARDRLRQLLQIAFERVPYRMIYASILGKGKGNKVPAMAAFVQSLKTKGVDLETSDFSGRSSMDDLGRSSSMTDRGWRTGINYILSNLRLMEGTGDENGHTVSRLEVYRELGTSTNEPIKSWLPEKCGVVPYIRARTGHILTAYYEKLRSRDRVSGISLDAFHDLYGIELSEKGSFVRIQPNDSENRDDMENFDIDNPHGVDWKDVDEDVRALEDTLTASALGRDNEEKGKEEELTKKDAAKAEIDLHISGLKADPASSGDWPLRAFDPQYAEEAIEGGSLDLGRIRAAAENLLRRLLYRDETLTADFSAILDALRDWDGSMPLISFVEEIAFYAEKYRYELAGISPLPIPVEGAIVQREFDLLSQMETPALAADHLFGAVPEPEMPSLVHSRFAERSISLCHLLTEDCDETTLDDPDRSDYLFLCQEQNEHPAADIGAQNLFQEIRRLTKAWCSALENHGIGESKAKAQELSLRLRTWDPAAEHLATAFNRALAEMTKREWEVSREREIQPSSPSSLFDR